MTTIPTTAIPAFSSRTRPTWWRCPNFCPDTPPLKGNPVFLFYSDGFQKPNPFQADVVVSIDAVIDKKLDALNALESQFYEGGAKVRRGCMPSGPAKQAGTSPRGSRWSTPAATRASRPGAVGKAGRDGTARRRPTR